MKKFIILLTPLFLMFIFFSCQNKPKKVITAEDIRKYEEKNIEINKEIVKLKQDTIQQYIQEHNLSMTKSGSGLWYSISRGNDTTSIQTGDLVKIAYTVHLLNGKFCYSSDSTGLKEFKVGQGGVESGLEEAILLMHKGDTADLIIPPHLAHGLIGDQQKIPVLAILKYHVVVVNHLSRK